jgi:hypothetical protein
VSQIYYGSNYGYYSPEPPSSGYEGKPTENVGFRLAHDEGAFQETRGRCWESRVLEPEWQLDHPAETGDNLGFRLAWERP